MRTLLLLALLFPAAASAAEGTEWPARLRGDAFFTYDGGVELARLDDRASVESPWVQVGRSLRQSHGMRIEGAFTAYPGIVVRLGLPIVFHDRRVWNQANDMIWNPEASRATMVGGAPLTQDVADASLSSRTRAGFSDIWFGARFVPFAQEGLPGRDAPMNLGVDLAVVLPTGGNAETARDNGTTGPGPGGGGFRLSVTSSRRAGPMEPFFVFGLDLTAPTKVALQGATGDAVTAADTAEDGRTPLDPADRANFRFGSEIWVTEDRKIDGATRILLSVGAGIVTPGELSSGRLLPAPLDPTVGHVALEEEHLVLDLLWGLRVRPKAPVEVRLDVGVAWTSPHSVERLGDSTYTVRTGSNTLRIHGSLGAVARFR